MLFVEDSGIFQSILIEAGVLVLESLEMSNVISSNADLEWAIDTLYSIPRYFGKYVAIRGRKVIATGSSAEDVERTARAHLASSRIAETDFVMMMIP